MQLVERPFLPPGICFVCERAWQPGNRPWIDTLSTFDVGVVTFLTGHKYVCDGCAHKIALLLGFVSPEDFSDMMAKLAEIEAKNEEMKGRIADLVVVEKALMRVATSMAEEADASGE